jgi:hypothetical protein
MPWTTPVSKSSGNVLNASDWTTNTVSNPNFLARPPRAFATMSSSQSITSSTAYSSYTLVQINNLQVGGSGDNPTLVSNTLRPQVAGLYRVVAQLHWPNATGATTGQRVIRISQNGSTAQYCAEGPNTNPSGGGTHQGTTQNIEAWITCAVNDQIGLGCMQDNASLTSFSIQANTYLAMELIAVT